MRVKETIYLPDFMILLRYLGDGKKHTMPQVSNETGMTYPHIFKMKKVFYARGWINIEKVGPRHDISITEEGSKVVKCTNELMVLFNIDDEWLKSYRAKTKFKKPEDKLEEQFEKEVSEGKIKDAIVPDDFEPASVPSKEEVLKKVDEALDTAREQLKMEPFPKEKIIEYPEEEELKFEVDEEAVKKADEEITQQVREVVKDEIKTFNEQFVEEAKKPFPEPKEYPRPNLPPFRENILDNIPGGVKMPYSSPDEEPHIIDTETKENKEEKSVKDKVRNSFHGVKTEEEDELEDDNNNKTV